MPTSSANEPGAPSARIAAISRDFASRSTAAGRRASRAIRSMMGSSSESIIPDSIPTFAKALACPLYAHLQRRDSRPRQHGHLLVAQLFHVLEEERFPQQRVQLVQHALDEFLVLARPVGPRVRRIQQQCFFVHEHPLAMRPASRDASTLIRQNPIQPRAELVLLLILPQRA